MLDALGRRLAALIPGGDLFTGDTLTDAIVDVVSVRVMPIAAQLIAETQRALIASTRPDAPTNYAVEMRAIAPNLTDPQLENLWAATWRAICSEKKKPTLSVVTPEAMPNAG